MGGGVPPRTATSLLAKQTTSVLTLNLFLYICDSDRDRELSALTKQIQFKREGFVSSIVG